LKGKELTEYRKVLSQVIDNYISYLESRMLLDDADVDAMLQQPFKGIQEALDRFQYGGTAILLDDQKEFAKKAFKDRLNKVKPRSATKNVLKQAMRRYIAERIVYKFKENPALSPRLIFNQITDSFQRWPNNAILWLPGHLGTESIYWSEHQVQNAIRVFEEVLYEVQFKFDQLAGDGVLRWLSLQHLITLDPDSENKAFIKGYVKFLFQTKDGQPDYNALPILLFLPDPYVPPYIRFGKNLKADTVLKGKKLTEYRKLLKEAIHNHVDWYLDLPRQILEQRLKKPLSSFAKVRGVKGRSVGFGGKGRYEKIKPPLGMTQEQYLSREGRIKTLKSAPMRTIKDALKLPGIGMFHDYLSGMVPFVKFDHPRFETFLPAMGIGNTLLNDQKEYAKEVLQDKLRVAAHAKAFEAYATKQIEEIMKRYNPILRERRKYTALQAFEAFERRFNEVVWVHILEAIGDEAYLNLSHSRGGRGDKDEKELEKIFREVLQNMRVKYEKR